jgi:hypothetical protein
MRQILSILGWMILAIIAGAWCGWLLAKFTVELQRLGTMWPTASPYPDQQLVITGSWFRQLNTPALQYKILFVSLSVLAIALTDLVRSDQQARSDGLITASSVGQVMVSSILVVMVFALPAPLA